MTKERHKELQDQYLMLFSDERPNANFEKQEVAGKHFAECFQKHKFSLTKGTLVNESLVNG